MFALGFVINSTSWLKLTSFTSFTDCKGANVADIVFIVDESGSITTPNFQLIRIFLHSIISGLDVNQTAVRVGIVTYHDTPTAHFYLDTAKSRADILRSVSVLPYRGGGTKTGAALNFTRDKVFTGKRGKRKNVQQVAVLITDGESDDNVTEAAKSLRRAGVTIYAIGIRNASKSELEKVASHTSNVFNVDKFTDLKPLRQRLQKTLCSNIIDVTKVPVIQTDIKRGLNSCFVNRPLVTSPSFRVLFAFRWQHDFKVVLG